MLWYYQLLLALSLVICFIYLLRWNKRIDLSYTMVMALVLIFVYGAYMRSSAKTLEASYLGNTVTYIGGCYLQLALTFCVVDFCRVKMPKLVRIGLFVMSSVVYGMVLTDSRTHLFYKSVDIEYVNGVTHLIKEYGPFHYVFYAMLIVYFAINVGLMIYAHVKKKDASIRSIFFVFLIEFINIFVYFAQKFFPDVIQLNVLSHVISQIIVLLMLTRLTIYDVDSTVVNALLESNILGCFSFTLKRKYIGCNSICEKWLPELTALRVDEVINSEDKTALFVNVRDWMEHIDKKDGSHEFFFKKDEAIYKITGGYFYEDKKKLGYQFSVRDFTKEQKLVDLISNYNTELEAQVEEKTKDLSDMHERMILNMADMVESRDNSTGHHIKRTSKVVRILISKMLEDNKLGLDEQFCRAVIKAAPMHDLGKIAVDDVILRKPGKFTEEEFEIMKSHAPEGAKIVHKLLKDTQDDYFAQVAENVAHYHHERMDGTGYPCKLKGEEIPLEARIMAIADVYDALVSKRCYKESMSFEQSLQIILDGMGTQFDEKLEPYLLAARPELEAFYTEEFKKAKKEEK